MHVPIIIKIPKPPNTIHVPTSLHQSAKSLNINNAITNKIPNAKNFANGAKILNKIGVITNNAIINHKTVAPILIFGT